jgi:predicted  nucleic acid-binding Zn-ribbon protein
MHIMGTIKDYKEELERYKEELENGNDDVEQDVVDLEMKIEQEIQEMAEYEDTKPFHKLLKELKSLKREFDFYDEDSELDRMFPDRHDEDFDEDSMSYDSVFVGV